MRMSSRFVLEGGVLALLLAAAGCTKPSTDNGAATGGSSGTATGGQTGAKGGSTGTGGAATTGTGGAATTGTGGSTTTGTGTGGSATTGTGGSPTGATGGATGTGGSTTSGTGGAGGAIVQKDCATKTKIMSPLFMDFENYNGTVTATNYATAFGGTTVNTGTAYAGIYPYPESAGSTTPTLAILAGHPPSNWAGSETLQATQWGMGGGVWMGCADATAYKGISFWVRGSSGTGMFSFSVSMESTQLPDASNPAGGGTCPGTTDTCKDPIKSNIPITSDWTQVQILWSDFTAGISGTASVVPNGDNIAGMAWTVPLQFHLDPSVSADAAGPYIPIPGTMTINIDDISFIQ
jgi:hypothetical protein